MKPALTLLGFGVCTPDEALRNRLPFPSSPIDRTLIPATLRRRTSQATQLAFTAATAACAMAGRPPAGLPAVFASVGGEIQTTDRLCVELAKPDGCISATAFHNSVHNTAAAYWSIAHGCTLPASALAGGAATVAMALLECGAHLACVGGAQLLVCYDEYWPHYLAGPMGELPFAAALALTAAPAAGGLLSFSLPEPGPDDAAPGEFSSLLTNAPAAAVLPLLLAAARQETGRIRISATRPGWFVQVQPGTTC